MDPETRAGHRLATDWTRETRAANWTKEGRKFYNRRTLKSVANDSFPKVLPFFFTAKKIGQAWPILETHRIFNKSINAIGPKSRNLSNVGDG